MPDRQPEMCRWMDLRRRHKTPMLTEMTQTHQAREHLSGKFMKSESERRYKQAQRYSVRADAVTNMEHTKTFQNCGAFCLNMMTHVGEARAIWDVGHYGKSLYLHNSESSNCICVFHYSSVICRLRRASNIYIL